VTRSPRCLNCDAPTPDEYCSRCGQKNADYRESLREIVGDVAQELFQFDSRIGRTLVPFLFQPGKLSEEWAAGRRMRYSAPLRIFLLLSVSYFFALSLVADRPKLGVHVGPHSVSFEPVNDAGAVTASASFGMEAPDGGVDGGAPADRPEGDEPSLLWRLRHSWFAAKEAETPQERSDRVFAFMLSAASKAVFVLIPIFALLLHALFFRARRYYVEHLVFAVHLHSFLFVLMLVDLVLPWSWPLPLIGLSYTVLALRRMYRATVLQLVWKVSALAFVYLLVLALSVAVVALAALALS